MKIDGITIVFKDIRTITQADCVRIARVLPQRYARAQEFVFRDDRLRCLGAGLLLADALGITADEQLHTGSLGKPEAPGFPHFNLSHSGNYVVMAYGPDPVGIDIEKLDPRHTDVAHRIATPAERAWLDADILTNFFVLWTQKESAMKLLGAGLEIDPLALCAETPGWNTRIRYDDTYNARGTHAAVAHAHLHRAPAGTAMPPHDVPLYATSRAFDDCIISVCHH